MAARRSKNPTNPAAPPTPTFISYTFLVIPAGSRGTKSTIARFAISPSFLIIPYLPETLGFTSTFATTSSTTTGSTLPERSPSLMPARLLLAMLAPFAGFFYFLETWGLINYSPSVLNKCLMWEDKGTEAASHVF